MNKSPSESLFLNKVSQIILRYMPSWLINYNKLNLSSDIIAGLVVGLLVIPQSLGYAVLAGLPAEYGIYSSIVPVLVYAWIGSNSVQAVGPVAITAIMTSSTLANYSNQGIDVYISMSSWLAILVGGMLWLAGKLKLGWLLQFISRGVSSGFISAAAVLIFFSQTKYLMGLDSSGNTIFTVLSNIYSNFSQIHFPTLVVGLLGFVLLVINRYSKLWQLFFSEHMTKWIERLFPLVLLLLSILVSSMMEWKSLGIPTIGNIPSGLPRFYVPHTTQIFSLLPGAGLMALIAFVSSSSVGSFYARQRGENFDSNLELRGLGLANIFGGFFQSFTVAGGFSRTAVNVESGAQSPIASIITVAIMTIMLIFLRGIIDPLPYALLGATVMSSIIGLIDLKTFRLACRVDRVDAFNMGATFIACLVFGLNIGLVMGLLISFANLVWQSSHPHIAIVGNLEGTEHFRNINRHDVQTFDNLLIIRIDESLFFGNSIAILNQLQSFMLRYPNANEVIMIMSSVNHIDLTAQEMLISFNEEMVKKNKRLHYSFIKGPVMDVISQTAVIQELSGSVFLNTMQAVNQLKK